MSKNPTQDLARQALDVAGDMSDRVSRTAHDGIDALRDQAARVGDQTVGYIRHEPVKAMMAAAAIGAVAALLLGWLGHSRGHHRY